MLTNDEFLLFRNLIYEESGIYLKEDRKDYLENRLLKRMTETKTVSPYWYYKLITQKVRDELLIFLDMLTVNETSFFRNRPQMDLFRKLVLPEILMKNSRIRKSLRIWSAGCSTGEEPYSIAMMLCDAVELRGWDVKILASDLSLTALQAAAKGEYAADKVKATVDGHSLARFFNKKGDDHYRIKDDLKKLVVFDYHNMKNENGISDLDVIFCRNVMIYFDAEEKKRLVSKFYNSLNPCGYLLIGHAESLQGMNTGFQFIHDNKGTAYKKSVEEKTC